jgi:arsenate reductase (glutaredoxin)
MTSIQVYGIPTCGTCKKALKWLDTQQISYEFINTKEQPPSLEQIANWVTILGNKAMRNTSGQSYRALDETKDSWNDAQWVTAFSDDVMLLNSVPIAVGFRDVAKIKADLES